MSLYRQIAALLLMAGALLGGCTSGTRLPDERKAIAELLTARGLPQTESIELAPSAAADQTNAALDVVAAVQLALVGNPRMDAEYARLGLAAADIEDARRLSNPRLSASVLFPSRSADANQTGFGIAQSFTDLLLLSARKRLASAELEQVRFHVGAVIQQLAADTQVAWYRLSAAQQICTLRESAARVAEAGATLSERFHRAGNIDALQLAQDQAGAAQARIALAQARADVGAAHNALNQQMGFTAEAARWELNAHLPPPPTALPARPALLALADTNRLDLAAARMRVKSLADSLGVTRRFRWLGDVEIGAQTERETDRSRITGPSLALELPLFNQGQGRVARAAATLQQADADLRALEIDISNSLQQAADTLDAARTRATESCETLLPLHASIVQRTQERINFMLDGYQELLTAKQQELAAGQACVEARRDYWIARVELTRAAGGDLPGMFAEEAGAESGAGNTSTLPENPPRDDTTEADSGGHRGHEAHKGHQP